MASFKKYFQNHTKNNFKQKQVIQQVTKSPWITMDKKGANTFPFHKSTPRTQENISKGLSCAFSPFLLDKIKVGGDSC